MKTTYQKKSYFLSPLEQFVVFNLFEFAIKIGNQKIYTIELTNIELCFLFYLGSLYLLCLCLYKPEQKGGTIVPKVWHTYIELIYFVSKSIVTKNIFHKPARKFNFPQIFLIFILIIGLNLSGLIPYSYTVTSSAYVCGFLALYTFIWGLIQGAQLHGRNFFTIFYPEGISIYLAFILIPIEIVSYCLKPVSLGTRLFANMVAGHALLKVLMNFSSPMVLGSDIIGLQLFPYLIIYVILWLELAVAVIQAYVFATLFSMNVNQALELH